MKKLTLSLMALGLLVSCNEETLESQAINELRDVKIGVNSIVANETPMGKSLYTAVEGEDPEVAMNATDGLETSGYRITLRDASNTEKTIASNVDLSIYTELTAKDVTGDFTIYGNPEYDYNSYSSKYTLNANSVSGTQQDSIVDLLFTNTKWAFIVVDGEGDDIQSANINGNELYPLSNNDFYIYKAYSGGTLTVITKTDVLTASLDGIQADKQYTFVVEPNGDPDAESPTNDKQVLIRYEAGFEDDATEIHMNGDSEIIEFADANLKNALINSQNMESNQKIDRNEDGEISVYEAEAVIGGLYLNNKGISNTSGLEYFKNISYLQISNNNLDSLDVSSFQNMTSLEARYNSIDHIDLSQNSKIKYLYLGGNSLTSIDVSNLSDLRSFDIWNNALTSLDVSNNTKLTDMDTTSNYNLDVIYVWDVAYAESNSVFNKDQHCEYRLKAQN